MTENFCDLWNVSLSLAVPVTLSHNSLSPSLQLAIISDQEIGPTKSKPRRCVGAVQTNKV